MKVKKPLIVFLIVVLLLLAISDIVLVDMICKLEGKVYTCEQEITFTSNRLQDINKSIYNLEEDYVWIEGQLEKFN